MSDDQNMKRFDLFKPDLQKRSARKDPSSGHAYYLSNKLPLRDEMPTPDYTPETSPLPVSHPNFTKSLSKPDIDNEIATDKWSDAARLVPFGPSSDNQLPILAHQLETIQIGTNPCTSTDPKVYETEPLAPKPTVPVGAFLFNKIQSAPASPSFASPAPNPSRNVFGEDLIKRPHSAALPNTEKLVDFINEAYWHGADGNSWPDGSHGEIKPLPMTPARSPKLSSISVPRSSPLTPLSVPSNCHSRSASLAEILNAHIYSSRGNELASRVNFGTPVRAAEGSARRQGKGRVKFFHPVRGYGFIVPDDDTDNEEIFVHYTVIFAPSRTFKSLLEDSIVEFEACRGPKGWYAVRVTGPDGAEVPQPPQASLNGAQFGNLGGVAGGLLGIPSKVPDDFVRRLKLAMRNVTQLVERLPTSYRDQALVSLNNAFIPNKPAPANPPERIDMPMLPGVFNPGFMPVSGGVAPANVSLGAPNQAPATYQYVATPVNCIQPLAHRGSLVGDAMGMSRFSTSSVPASLYASVAPVAKPLNSWDSFGLSMSGVPAPVVSAEAAHPYYVMYPSGAVATTSASADASESMTAAESVSPNMLSNHFLNPSCSSSCPGSPYHFQSENCNGDWLDQAASSKESPSDLRTIVEKAKLRRIRENLTRG